MQRAVSVLGRGALGIQRDEACCGTWGLVSSPCSIPTTRKSGTGSCDCLQIKGS